MIREEFLAASNAYLERLMMAVHELPEERMHVAIAEGAPTVCELFSDLAARAEVAIRSLERLYQGLDPDQTERPAKSYSEFKRAQAALRIAQSTIAAALERIPRSHLASDSDLPTWLTENYLDPLAQVVPVVETWAKDLRARGLGGPTGLQVIQ